MTTETHLTNLKINRLTYAQYQQAESQGLINPNELYFITDGGYVISALAIISGYNASVAQTLKHDASGNIKWVND